MADVSVKMGVSGVSQFIQSMNAAGASVKTIDAALKQNEKQLKATGDAETYMRQKSDLLNGKLEAQKKSIKETENALKQLEKNGADPAGQAYQNLQRKLLDTQSAMMDTQQEIQSIGTESKNAAGKTDQLASSLGGISKKVSLEQVIGGIDRITGGLETAAKKALELGQAMFDAMMDRAQWADDTATQAMMLDMSVEDYQRYRGVFDTIGEMTVSDWMKAKQKVQKAIYDPTSDQIEVLEALGISTTAQGKYGAVETLTKDWESVFWEVGQQLNEDVASGKLTQDKADTYAQALFGKGFASLKPLMALGPEAFAAALEEQNVVSEEAVDKMAELNDTVTKLKTDFASLETEIMAGMAPALTKAAEVLDSLLGNLMDFLQTPEGKEMLDNLSTAVSGLFEDLSNIDPESVVSGFTAVFDKVVGGVQWLVENKDNVVAALDGILKGWAGLKLTGTVLQLVKLIDGIKGLGLLGGGAKAAASAGGGGVFSKAWNGGKAALGGAKDAILAGGSASILAFLAAEGALGYAGAKMIDANLNDPELIQIYGTGNNDSMISTMSDAAVRAAEEYWQVYQDTGSEKAMEAREKLEDVLLGEGFTKSGQGVSLIEQIFDNMLNGSDPDGLGALLSGRGNFENGVPIPVVPEAPEDAADVIAAQVGTVTLPVRLHFNPGWGGGLTNGTEAFMHANGLWSVPWDGYPAILHKNERIMPAREVASRSFSSNLYVESMVMNGGADADGLAQAIAARNQRVMAGFGS